MRAWPHKHAPLSSICQGGGRRRSFAGAFAKASANANSGPAIRSIAVSFLARRQQNVRGDGLVPLKNP